MKRVIFVGVHNKPCKDPLDSTTVSGKRIDAIISHISNRADCVKTNLWEIDRMPTDRFEKDNLELAWFTKYLPRPENDIVVLLGGIIHYSFPKIMDGCIIRLAHPSLQYSKMKSDDYIKNAVVLINDKINRMNNIGMV